MGKRKSSTARRIDRVRDAFDADMLKSICERPQNSYGDYATRVNLPDTRPGRENFYYYRDNGAPILAVAHLDHVQSDPTCTVVDTKDGPFALSGALDDRLGAYVILELLPKLGVETDVLLTTNEELGASTARDFDVDHKDYNWLIEFDRGGTDVVMYDYETDALCRRVEKAGAHVGLGSYSDIADLEHLGVAGFNWGVGYYDYHSKRAHAWLDDTFRMVAKFLRFYAANAAVRLDHTPQPSRWAMDALRYGGLSRYDREAWGDDIYAPEQTFDYEDVCPACVGELSSWDECWTCGHGIILDPPAGGRF